MTDQVPHIRLRPGRDGPARGGHPWVFSGSIAAEPAGISDGAEVDVLDASGDFVARGLYNGRSQIRVRLYARRPVPLDAAFFAERIGGAVRLRRDLLRLMDPEGACRLVFSEGDGLSGLTVDRYRDVLAVQFTSLALARRAEEIYDALQAETGAGCIVLRTEKGILEEEGLELRDGVAAGNLPDGPLEIREDALRFSVDVRTGHKTGFYLDQRENRRRAAAYAEGRRVADVCCYTGGFAVTLARAGAASVVGVDASERALELARRNAALNDVEERTTFERGDAYRWLQEAVEAGRIFDMIVLDPPRFARARRGVPSALRAYERLNGLAIRCLARDGVLVTCSCSGRVPMEGFAGALGRAAAASGRAVQILERGSQPPDHPVSATCPESAYLKCLVCRVV